MVPETDCAFSALQIPIPAGIFAYHARGFFLPRRYRKKCSHFEFASILPDDASLAEIRDGLKNRRLKIGAHVFCLTFEISHEDRRSELAVATG